MAKRKHISILFLFIFIFSNVGWSLNMHYCQGEYVGSLFSVGTNKEQHHLCHTDKEESMPCCSASENSLSDISKKEQQFDSDCCETEIIQHHTSELSYLKIFPIQLEALQPTEIVWTPERDFNIESKLKKALFDFYIDSNAPPLFKLYCQYIFYA